MGKYSRGYDPGRRAPGNVSTDEGPEPTRQAGFCLDQTLIRILRIFILILSRCCSSRLGLRGGEGDWESHVSRMLTSAKQ